MARETKLERLERENENLLRDNAALESTVWAQRQELQRLQERCSTMYTRAIEHVKDIAAERLDDIFNGESLRSQAMSAQVRGEMKR